MIVFDLSCADGHKFEGWFRNSDDYDHQLKCGLLTCPKCGSNLIYKVPSPSRLNVSRQSTKSHESAVNTETHFEDVGAEFKNEALKMHYGEKEKRNIKGIATHADAIELKEEGVDVYYLSPHNKQKLN